MMTPRELALASLGRVKAGDRDGWLALWEEDGIIEDPVGPSPTCPDGKGHRGKPAIAKFYDDIISTVAMDFKIEQSFECADEVAVHLAMWVTPKNHAKIAVEAINVYRRSKNGKLASLRSFWEIPKA